MAQILDTDYVGDSLDKLLLNSNTTVNLTSSQTATQIQAEINAQPKNLNGYDLTFQFADGTYALDAALTFKGFHGGTFKIYGNASDNSLSTSKSVDLTFNNNTSGIIVDSCSRVEIYYCDISHNTDVNTTYGVHATDIPDIYVRYCYIHGNSNVRGSNAQFLRSLGVFRDNYVSNVQYALFVANSATIYCQNCDDTGTQPAYGLYSVGASTIGKNGTQPSGSTANESSASGGVIR